MGDDRRYDAEEIEQIFAAAAAEGQSPSDRASRGGLSLPELQSIGREVGISPERVAAAADSLDRRTAQPGRVTVAGVPIGVGRVFDLPRKPNEREWGMLVAEFRRTFGAEGKVTATDELREWRNGNLFAAIEPTTGGYQLRFSTRKGTAPMFAALAGGWVLVGGGVLMAGDVDGFVLSLLMALIFLIPLFRIPNWASLRENQMQAIGREAVEMLGAPARDGA